MNWMHKRHQLSLKYFHKQMVTKDGRLLPTVEQVEDKKSLENELNLIPINRSAKKPTKEEVAKNRRSKSAKLRVVERRDQDELNTASGM